ncbi:MAG: hypothetical protein HFJ59_03350 [Clostridia bacterium]|nr:hypothetical protein [Clostridia bacterium]
MENASKALLMAGGILIAILIISALLLMVTHLGDYQSSQDNNKKATQVGKFNREFEKYTDDNGVKGTDIVSLINKIADYNSRQTTNSDSATGTTNYVDYTVRMSITIRGLNEFNIKYAYDKDRPSNQLFSVDVYKFGFNSGNAIKNRLDEIADSDNNPNVDLKKWSSIYNPESTENENKNQILKYIKESKKISDNEWLTKKHEYENYINMDAIKWYRQYSEFKTSKFRSYQDPDYENGQIQNLYFEFVD